MSVTKMYSVQDKWTDLEKENIVDFTSIDGVVTQARLNGVPVGGGGGNFTTAEITLNLTPPEGVDITALFAHDAEIVFPSEYATYKASNIYADENNKLTVLLYNGTAYIGGFSGNDEYGSSYNLDPETASFSGNAGYDSDIGRFIVTGSCTITGTLQPGSE